MRIYFIIKCLNRNRYLTFLHEWSDFFYAKTFDTEEEAIEEIERLDGHFIIEKVYHI